MEYKKVSELCEIKTGKYDANHAVENGKYLFYTCAMYPSKANTYSFEGNLIMLPGNGANLGEVMYYEGKIEAYQRTYVLYNVKCNSKYLYHYLRSMWKRYIFKRQVGSATNYMKLNDISELEIPLPSLNVQDKIASALDKAQEIIDKRNKQIVELDELIKSRFIQMFGDPVNNTKNWNITKLGELGYFKNGMNYKQSDSGFNIKFLGVGEFKYGNVINNSGTLPTLELQEKPNNEYLLNKGDIVFVRSNGSKELVGRSVLIRELEEDTTYSGFCIRYRNQSNEITSEFLNNLFSDEGFKSYFKKDSRGANINNLNQQMLSNLNIILPPIELQNEFADFIKQVDKLKFEMENSLKELEDNFNSLMQRAFKGALFND